MKDAKNERDAHFGVATPKTIGEPAYWDLIKCTKSIHGRHPTPIVSSNWSLELMRHPTVQLSIPVEREQYRSREIARILRKN